MNGLPLHPAVVHLPLGIVAFLPILTLMFLVLHKKFKINRSLLVVLALSHMTLTGVTKFAEETGEEEEDRLERMLGEEVIENHEHKAEEFMTATVVATVISIAIIFVATKFQMAAMIVLLIAQLALNMMAYRVGHSGGELIYKHGAAEAYR